MTRTPFHLRSRFASCLLLLGATAGCYRYVPVAPADVRPQEEVRVHVSEAAATRLVRELGTFTSELDGLYKRESPDSVSVAVSIGRDYRGATLENSRQVLYLGPSEVLDVRRRQFSRDRTVLVTAGAVALFSAVVATVVQLGDANPPGDDGTTTPPPIIAPNFPGFGLRFRIPIP